MKWFNRKDFHDPAEGVRILTFSPDYPEGHSMRFRIMDAQFLKISTEATHWAFLKGPRT